jgi:hypothetical protein
VLLKLLLKTFIPADTPMVFGLDPTIERRWGGNIAARGSDRDAVRSSDNHFVKTSGLRWISRRLLASIPWAQRGWALPLMTVRSPSERDYQPRGPAPKTLLQRSEQMLKLLRGWLPTPDRVVVGDHTYAALDFLAPTQRIRVTMMARLRLDAAWYQPAPPYSGRGRPRKKGARRPTLATVLSDPTTDWQRLCLSGYDGQQREMDMTSGTARWFHTGKAPVAIRWVLLRDPQAAYAPVALLGTDPQHPPSNSATGLVQRWRLEVTFEAARRQLGVETQRQWSDRAIARTTPVLLGLFSWVTLLAHALYSTDSLHSPRQAIGYPKPLPSFSDALALVRHHLWTAYPTFRISREEPHMLKIPKPFFDTLVSTLSYAA